MIVIVRNFGQLGNRLLLSAHLIAAAREYGVTLLNPSFAEYARYFPSTARDLWCRYPSLPSSKHAPSASRRNATYKAVYLSGKSLWYAKKIGCSVPMIRLGKDEACDLRSEEFRRLAQSSIPLLVSGWEFRSKTLLEKHAEAVRTHYQILPEHRSRVSALMRRVRQQADVVIGVHIRHGDYAKYENGKYFYTLQQYVAVMRRIRDQLDGYDVAFLTCGNARFERRDFDELNVHFGTGHLVEDMYSFAETDLLIGPPSTFTGWASFFGRVPVQFMNTAEEQFELPTFSARSHREKLPETGDAEVQRLC